MADFDIELDGQGFVLSGEFDMEGAPAFAAAFAEALGRGGPVSVDMRRLTFMDSSGIQTIIAAAEKAAPDTCVVLHGVHDEVQKVVEMTGIEPMIANLHVMPCTVGVQPS
jgi:anti-sigma B factor antagonist